MTPAQARLFKVLEQHRGTIVSYGLLVAAMYAERGPPRTAQETLRVQLHRLRAALPPDEVIENLHGHGYRLNHKPAPTPQP
jgi:DNA-binding response OmpR family regulator